MAESNPRAGTFYDRDRDRWYRDPTNPSKTYAGVTSVLNVRNKLGLNKAKITGVINYAASNRTALAGMNKGTVQAILKDQDAILPDWSVGRDYGTAVHQVIENIINSRPLDFNVKPVEGTDTYPVSNTFTDWVPGCWNEFVDRFKVEVAECEETVMSDEHRYAGSFDTLCWMTTASKGRHLALVDTKSNKKGPHADVCIQNKAYSKAPEIVDMTTGARRPMPAVEASYVLWMNEHTISGGPGWNLMPLSFGDQTWRVFYAMLLVHGFTKTEHEFIGDALNGPEEFKRWIPAA